MKYISQYIDLNKIFLKHPGPTFDWEEGFKNFPPPDDKEYNWTIFNTHVTFRSCLIIIWQGVDKVFKGPDKPPKPSSVPPKQSGNSWD